MISERRGISRRDIDRRAILPKPPEPIKNWLRYVKRNHGGHVSERTIRALGKFYRNLKLNTSLFNKILVLNPLVPDNLGACFTPLIDITGKFNWINSGTLAKATDYTSSATTGIQDLTINGLARQSGLFHLNTQFNPSLYLPSYNNAGLTTYISESYTSDAVTPVNSFFGSTDGTNTFYFNYKNVARDFMLFPNDSEASGGQVYSNVYVNSEGANWQRGYLSFNRIGNTNATDVHIWKANGHIAHFDDIAGFASSNSTTSIPNYNCYFLGVNASDSTVSYTSNLFRFSFLAIHAALLVAESQAFFNLIFQLRNDIGGGAVTFND